MSEFIIQDESLSNIGDAVRDVLNNNNSVTLADLPNTIRGLTNIPTVDSPKLWELSFGTYHVKTGCSVAFNSAQNTTETINFTSALVIIGKNSASANNKQYIIIASDLLNNETYKSKIISGIIEDQIVLNDNSNTQHNYVNHSNNFISQSDLSSTLNASSTNLEAPTAKAVYDYVTAVVSNVYKYKGSVATYTDLPTENVSIGDVYNVQDSGMNYAWTGAEWDGLGVIVDISSKEDKINKVSKINGNSTDEQYPSAKAVFDYSTKTLDNPRIYLLDKGVYNIKNGAIYGSGSGPFFYSYINCTYGLLIVGNAPAGVANGCCSFTIIPSYSSLNNNLIYGYCTKQTSINAETGESADTYNGVSYALESNKNRVTELTAQNTDLQYPSAKAVYNAIQAALYVDSEATV